ncbi:MAG: hypothetical protein K8R23_15465 [Chthoniobacter sp.]|nr:hypothetical protein [Chthoniobacter sp.]
MRKSSLSHIWRASVYGLVLALAPWGGAAERKKDPLPEIPPPVQPLTVKVQRGENVEIQLRIHGSRNEPLRFLIRTPPEHGRLTEPRALNREIGVVTYTPPANPIIMRDRFLYAVQTSVGVSASAEVAITILDSPPELALPEALNFSLLPVGSVVTKQLELVNRGGGIAEGKVVIGTPWKIDGPAGYRLTSGARMIFKIAFAPEAPGIFDTLMRFTSQPEASVTVHGEAIAALTAIPAKIALQQGDVGDPVRAGSFELTNATDTERRVELTGGVRLQIPRNLTVPAQGAVKVSALTAANDVASLDDEIRVEARGFAVVVPVRAAAVGPIVRTTRSSVSFGRVDATKSAEAGLELENIGGTVANVSLEIVSPFKTEPRIQLAPGEKKSVILRMNPAAAGRHRALLKVKGERQELEIPVEAELFAAAVSVPPTEVATPPAVPASEIAITSPASPATSPTASLPEGVFANLRPVAGVKTTAVTQHTATLEWPVALHGATQFRVEYRILEISPESELQVRWDALPGVSIRREGDRYVAALRELEPATHFGVRVVPLTPGGETTEPLFFHHFATLPKRNWLPTVTPLRILLAVLAGCVFFVWRQRRAERRRI